MDLHTTAAHVDMPLDVVENEKLRFWTKVGCVPDTGALEVVFGALGDGAWVTVVALHGSGLGDVTTEDDGGVVGERIQH